MGEDRQYFFDVMRDIEHAWRVPDPGDRCDCREEMFPRKEVEACTGFVEDQQLGRTHEGAGDEYFLLLALVLSGVLAMACFGIAINTSYGFFIDRDNGIFYEFLTYPMTRAQFLIGKIVFNCLMSLAQAALTIVLGVLLLGIPIIWDRAIVVLLGVALGTAGWFFFLAVFALRIRRNDMFNTFINVAYFVLMFASSMFYPLDQLPPWLRMISLVNPMTWHTDALRFATIGVGDLGVVLLEAGAFVLFLLLSFGAALQTIRRAILR